jgi:lipopolysaccharide/colanic/teichoic acid biosynthesis glycosyltransferase
MIKRLFDIICSFLGLVVLSPVILVLAIIIKVSAPGPVFYIASRIGRKGKPFRMFKFRTMVVNADQIGGPSTASDDPRLTSIGLFLKKFQLDEVPQLFNVLMGDMSLVGPRPEVKMYVDIMTDEEKSVILSVRPGLTDFASLWNFHEGEILKGSDDPEKAYMEKIRPEKIRLQIKYVKEKSLLTDIKIIFQTIVKIFR